jgi:hypothetical protein
MSKEEAVLSLLKLATNKAGSIEDALNALEVVKSGLVHVAKATFSEEEFEQLMTRHSLFVLKLEERENKIEKSGKGG